MRRVSMVSAVLLLALAFATVARGSIRPEASATIGGLYPRALLEDLDSVSHVVNAATGETLYSNQSGHVNIEYGVKMEHDSRFMIGSNTKLYSVVSLYQLQEAGKVNLTADVATLLDAEDFTKFGFPGQTKFCPLLPGNSTCQKITVHHLLAMTSGMYPQLNCGATPNAAGDCNPFAFAVSQTSIASMVGNFINLPLIHIPGTTFVYTNPNFILAAYLIEKISGMTYQAYVKTHISDVVGQTHTHFDFFDGEMGPVDAGRTTEYLKFYDNATSADYERLSYGRLQTTLNTGAVSGTGGIVSTVNDEAQFWMMLFNKTSKGAPLLNDPASQASILFPWTYTGMTEITQGVFVYNYYTQGLGILCADRGCPAGPEFITYTGGTFASQTSNGLAYGAGCNMTLAQYWTSTVQAAVSKEELHVTRAAQLGRSIQIVGDWQDNVPVTATLKWLLMDQFTTCTIGSRPLSEVAKALAAHEKSMFRMRK